MAYRIEFMQDGTGFHLTGLATVLGSEIIAAAAEAHRDEARARRLRYALVDLADLTEFRVATEEVRLIVAEAIEWLRENKVWPE